ncbi:MULTISPECIES: DUF262 domain-containing protein [unclassified Rathayibacter]|uniref:DUF262 domain-containing protein n=1 Tax=unclassified Rathayibacter TaxID=2609250 RepID=UPI000CE89035|nr:MULTISPECIES: DUF262 domain-containing protein [unclassified Rathayibacter]PPG06304.1 hypothetical protein C5C26_11900 [Rathayibacter sp. AY2B1]PPG73660.1 hypothetical protein C5C59_00985 [Rathayibacter sp. AY1F4]
MKRRLTTQDLTWFLDINGQGRLDLDPSYQRKSVWTRADRQYFLDTIFNNYPSPAIFLHKDIDDNGNATYHVIDGKQRLETVLMFVNNALPIKDTIGDTRLANKKWRDLEGEPDLRRTFWDYQFTVEMLDSIESAVVNEVFGRLNQNSRKLLPQEIRHSRYSGWFASFAESEAERPVWRQLKVSSAGRSRRMQDVQSISELMMVVISRNVVGFDQDVINGYYADYDDRDNAPSGFSADEFSLAFNEVAEYVRRLDEVNGTVSTYASSFANLYTLWCWLVLTPLRPEPMALADAYSEFMTNVDKAEEPATELADELTIFQKYARAARGATTDQKQRLARLDALNDFLAPKFN